MFCVLFNTQPSIRMFYSVYFFVNVLFDSIRVDVNLIQRNRTALGKANETTGKTEILRWWRRVADNNWV